MAQKGVWAQSSSSSTEAFPLEVGLCYKPLLFDNPLLHRKSTNHIVKYGLGKDLSYKKWDEGNMQPFKKISHEEYRS